jgi:homoserine/homoserine lactone efflux protein
MSLESWVVFCVTEAVLCVTPGPAVLLVVSLALRRGERPGLGAAAGIVAANAGYFALSAAGIAALLVASSELMLVLKWCGAAYLGWLGMHLILKGGCGAHRRPEQSMQRAFWRGLVVQGANPKAIAFFVALLPQFLDGSRPLAPQLLLLGASSVVIEYAALFAYVRAAANAGHIAGPRLVRLLERVGGGLLVGAGARLAVASHE